MGRSVTASFRELLAAERQDGRAVGAFTCYDLATAVGVLRAAEAARAPVILLVSCASFTGPGGSLLVAGLLAALREAGVAGCVQLDHVDDLATIGRAIELGVGAVMADGSKLSFEDNADLVREAAKLAHPRGAGIEAELGHIEGGEDVAVAAAAGALTDPDEACTFVARTGADCLAVSIGNVHGAYAHPPALDWQRLVEIRDRVDVPLSLHGASGLPADEVRCAVSYGIAKVNLNAELRKRAFEELAARMPQLEHGYRMLDLQDSLASAAAEVAGATLTLLRGGAEL